MVQLGIQKFQALELENVEIKSMLEFVSRAVYINKQFGLPNST